MLVGAAVSVATTFLAAKVTGQSYSWKDAGVAAVSGALSGLAVDAKALKWAAKIGAGLISGLYSGISAANNGASLPGAIASGVVTGTLTTFGTTNVCDLTGIDLGNIASCFVDTVFSTGNNLISAVTYKAATKKKTNRSTSQTKVSSISNKSSKTTSTNTTSNNYGSCVNPYATPWAVYYV